MCASLTKDPTLMAGGAVAHEFSPQGGGVHYNRYAWVLGVVE